ncbi:MAG: TatD family hydrolase [Phycisphaerae bacterium]|nr:TatD family hydrolase [Phycisphaerae bacterium]
MKLIDTHCHLTFDDLKDDIDGVVARSIKAGVCSWVTVGTEPGELEGVVALTERFENMYAALGYHPHDAKSVTDDDLKNLRKLCAHEKVVAVGETGLDFFYDHSPRQVQKDIFRAHLNIAEELKLPVIIHTRNAFDESMEILDEYKGRLKDVVIHCFSGTEEQTRLVLDRGYHVSFTGIVTFKKAEETREAAKLVPLDRLMVETDCPFISPEPVRNQRPCEPALMIHTARKIAEVKGMSLEDFAENVTETSKKFFNIK